MIFLEKTRSQLLTQSGAASATEEWRTLEIPFSSFKPENLRETLNTAELRRIAIVVAWQEFKADVAVSRLEFYR